MILQKLKKIQFPVLLTAILKHRLLCAIGITASFVIITLYSCNISWWNCNFQNTTSIPCPSCGLTRSFFFILKGKIPIALEHHPLSLILFLVWLYIIIITISPKTVRNFFLKITEKIENKTGITFIMIALYLIIGIERVITEIYNYL